ncbi:MAG: response regulator [Chloroflexota bacterium]
MAPANEHILVVENDPDIGDLIVRQALKPLGYQVTLASEGGMALQQAIFANPDLVIADLNLPGLSAKDLLVALSSQNINAPVILVAEKGQESDVIQSFRLGASDVLFWPARDAEVVAVVERALKQTRESRTRHHLDQKLKDMNNELQRKVQQLTIILGIARAVVSITNQRLLYDRILEGALQVASADIGWLTLRDDQSRQFLLIADRNLPNAWAKKRNQPMDDGISSLVGLSGETLVMHGPPMQKFKVATIGKSAAVVPIKVQNEVIGLLIVVRQADREIGREEQTLLEAIADFTSTSLVNARLFRALEQSAETARESEKRQNALLKTMRESVTRELQAASYPLNLVLTEMPGQLNQEQKQALISVQEAVTRLARVNEKT